MHKLQAVIKKELKEIPEGFTGIILKGHTVINIVDELPSEFDYLRISAHAEYGNAKKNNRGMSYILTNINGNPFAKFVVKTEGEGKFSTCWADITGKFITVNVKRIGEYIEASIYRCNIISPEEYNMGYPDIEEKLIWNYNGNKALAKLPYKLSKFQKALNATIEKTECYNCQCLHFYNDGGEI